MTQYRDEPDVHEALSGRLDSGAVLNVMLARIDAEKVATGISDITVNKAVKAGKVYSLDGKRVSVCQGSCHHQWQKGDFEVI